MARELRPCGTPAAYRRHVYHGEVPCKACADADRKDSRERMRKRRGGGGPKPLQPCGTPAAYQRHHRRNQKPCQACSAAWSAYMAAYKART
jgi:hypothetical protein